MRSAVAVVLRVSSRRRRPKPPGTLAKPYRAACGAPAAGRPFFAAPSSGCAHGSHNSNSFVVALLLLLLPSLINLKIISREISRANENMRGRCLKKVKVWNPHCWSCCARARAQAQHSHPHPRSRTSAAQQAAAAPLALPHAHSHPLPSAGNSGVQIHRAELARDADDFDESSSSIAPRLPDPSRAGWLRPTRRPQQMRAPRERERGHWPHPRPAACANASSCCCALSRR
jgi:hypothetical protein